VLDQRLRRSLLRTARAAIARAIGTDGDIPGPPPVGDPQSVHIALRAGAFVTLRIGGEFRGCIGYPDAELPLVEVVERCAVSAAISDPRFPPLTLVEWQDVHLEISVLGSIEAVDDITDIVVGRHGVIVEFGRRRGLLLPQVAVEYNWDAAELASQTCVKAGLPRDAWRKGARLFRFEAEVFGEGREEY
jgi:AmmeMemoRadiSam system protein A